MLKLFFYILMDHREILDGLEGYCHWAHYTILTELLKRLM